MYMYRNQYIAVSFNNVCSDIFKVESGVRQGGILSPLFFNLYIDDALKKVINSGIGCKLGNSTSNSIAYADDVSLLCPTPSSLQKLINIFLAEINKIKLKINASKCFIMIFNKDKSCDLRCNFYINNDVVEIVSSFKYLGFLVRDDLSDKDDIIKCRNKFYAEFNSILRKFSTMHVSVIMQMFKTYCSNLYGSDQWFNLHKCRREIRHFEVGYHKALKKIWNIPNYFSNHFICKKLNMLTFKHKLNFDLLKNAHTLFEHPCKFVSKNLYFFRYRSQFIKFTNNIWKDMYLVGDSTVLENDLHAVKSRVWFIQNREPSSMHVGNLLRQ